MNDREKVIRWLECCGDYDEHLNHVGCTEKCPYYANSLSCDPVAPFQDALKLLKEHEAIVHPESSCEMTYITDCCCDLCGAQLIREDNFCRCCGKRIEWEGR